MDFNKYDDVVEIKNYNGFIDRLGNFYKVSSKKTNTDDDSHNEWAEKYMSEKLNIKNFNLKQTTSMLLALSKLRGPASILINCFGFVYYSHDPFCYKPVIKAPDPKIANFKITEEQVDMLFKLMFINRENIDVLMNFEEGTITDYCGLDDMESGKKMLK